MQKGTSVTHRSVLPAKGDICHEKRPPGPGIIDGWLGDCGSIDDGRERHLWSKLLDSTTHCSPPHLHPDPDFSAIELVLDDERDVRGLVRERESEVRRRVCGDERVDGHVVDKLQRGCGAAISHFPERAPSPPPPPPPLTGMKRASAAKRTEKKEYCGVVERTERYIGQPEHQLPGPSGCGGGTTCAARGAGAESRERVTGSTGAPRSVTGVRRPLLGCPPNLMSAQSATAATSPREACATSAAAAWARATAASAAVA